MRMAQSIKPITARATVGPHHGSKLQNSSLIVLTERNHVAHICGKRPGEGVLADIENSCGEERRKSVTEGQTRGKGKRKMTDGARCGLSV